MERDSYSDSEIKQILSMKNVAVVGMSRDPSKDAHHVPKYLIENGYNVIPVNPTAEEILGRKCYKSLLDVPDKIDIVDVFRPSEHVPPIVKDAITKGAKVVWMQLGISNNEAAQEASKHGIKVVYNRCMLVEHGRLSH
ncbi:MAG TPA: CoA-binding protein [Nitrososphaerales archaeon]|nr:CoA-binding protein [Nitrososphaerales archaeon]